MSRFYDALREAGRHTPPERVEDTAGGAVENVLSELPVSTDAPIETAAPESQITAPNIDPPSSFVPNDLLDFAGFPADDPPRINGTIGTKTDIRFDQRTCLLPHVTNSVVLEYYRRLRTKVLQEHEANPFRTLLITSPSPQEGKTVTVLNLALSFAMIPSFRVLVIDGDLRRGTIAPWLGMDSDRPGFTNLIEGTAKLNDVILQCDDTNAKFLLRGNSKIPPAELLHSQRLSGEFRHFSNYFDMVLIDSAPLNLITDAQLLATQCDAVLLVARAFQTTRKSLEQAVQELAKFRVIGTVLNGGTRTHRYGRYNEYYKHD